ncbi:MAG TPA: T9SS type A sorting domain-containing protein, partial [Bacteroidales bacterium]|nr:T9SS type A sorting domain-containing protein [Bacteroidales bacterium]
QGLSDVDLTTMKYNEEAKKLVIGYTNGIIDILSFPGQKITSIPTIAKRQLYGSKAIRDIVFKHDTAYIATDFGLVTMNLQNNEFIHTAVLGNQGESVGVNAVTIDYTNAILFAATQKGIFSIGLHQNISDGFLWKHVPIGVHQFSKITHILYYNNVMYYSAAQNNWEQYDTIYSYSNSNTSVFDKVIYLEKITSYSQNLAIVSRRQIKLYNNGELLNIITNTVQEVNFSGICNCNNALWVSDYAKGIYSIENYKSYYPQGPYSNITSEVFCRNNAVHLVCGSSSAYQIGQYNVLVNGTWYGHVNWNVKNSICVYPMKNSTTYYYGTAGWGIVQASAAWNYDTVYNKTNSTIQNIYADNSPYQFITDIAADSKQNIWCVNKMVQYPLVVKTLNNQWFKFNLSGDIGNNFERLLIDKQNTIWIAGESKLVAFNANGTIENSSDDSYAYIQLSDDEGNIADRTTALAMDNEGVLWIGTTQGIARHTSPYEVFRGKKNISRIKIEIDGEVGYLLSSEKITCIAVDGANRKWIGTQNSGLFVISADGTKQLANYMTTNYPLPSNTINSISIQHSSGEVFIATDKGLVSVMSDATQGSETMEEIKIFPNPVREDYRGNIYIQGTVANAIIKITDMSGDLVFQTIANGGTGVWNGTNLLGERVATGVYLVYISNSDGSQTKVSKLLFIQ